MDPEIHATQAQSVFSNNSSGIQKREIIENGDHIITYLHVTIHAWEAHKHQTRSLTLCMNIFWVVLPRTLSRSSMVSVQNAS